MKKKITVKNKTLNLQLPDYLANKENLEQIIIDLLIEEKIKENFSTKLEFSKIKGFRGADFSTKIKSLHNRINWINDF
jgi:hypothetical protein